MHSPVSETAARPFPRGVVAFAVLQNVDDAVDDLDRILALFRRQAGGFRGRADLDAFAAARAGVGHGVGAGLQGGLECLGHRQPSHGGDPHSVPPSRTGLKALPAGCKT